MRVCAGQLPVEVILVGLPRVYGYFRDASRAHILVEGGFSVGWQGSGLKVQIVWGFLGILICTINVSYSSFWTSWAISFSVLALGLVVSELWE